jgi:hypothetical protein
MDREQIERVWFVRIVMVCMVGLIAVGAVPLLQHTFFPAAKTR